MDLAHLILAIDLRNSMLFLTLGLPIYGLRVLCAPSDARREPFYLTPPNRRPFKVVRQTPPSA